MSKLRVFLADDHVVVREGLKSMVNHQPDMELVGEASDGQAALQQAIGLGPDVAILDISMPGLNGAQVVQRLKRVAPQVKVLALSIHEDIGYLHKLLEAGADGYVLKRSAGDELILAIRSVAAGNAYLDPALAGKVTESLIRKQTPQAWRQESELSEREGEVLRLIAKGYSNKEIAAQLGISVRTIETYRGRALDKLGLYSRVEIVRYALQRGWLED